MRFDPEQLLNAPEAWEALDLAGLEDAAEGERQQILEVCNLYRSVFAGSEQGKYVLRDLVETFLVTDVARPGDDMLAVGIRQGQALVVKRILSFIETAKRGGV